MKNIAKRFIITVAHLEKIYKYQCIYWAERKSIRFCPLEMVAAFPVPK